MSGTPSQSLLLLSLFTRAMRWVLWLVIAAWLIFLGAMATLHWVIVPRIGELRPELEVQASKALGIPVRIGRITARPGGIFPSFELTQVSLLDPDGHEALNLPRVVASVSPASLWNLGFEHLYIDNPQLNVRRTQEGRIYVAGLDVSKDQDSDGRAADWFFSQEEFVIRNGSIQWTDEMRDMPTLSLEQLDLVVRNDLRVHEMRLDATPPADLGGRFSVKARFRQPLLQSHAGQWRDWSGQVFAVADRVDVAQLRQYTNLKLASATGEGAVRAWVDVANGAVRGATADVVLAQASLTLGPQLEALAMSHFSGRFAGQRVGPGFAVSTTDLAFDTEDGLHWPGGNVNVRWQPAEGNDPEHGEFKADRLDLSTLSQIARKLPLDARTHHVLQSYAPKGLVETVQASWQGSPEALTQFEVKGRVQQLAVAAKSAEPDASAPQGVVHPIGRPGLQGANVTFTLNQSGGQATVQMRDGQLEFPGVFEKPVVDVTQLLAELKWQLKDEALNVQLSRLQFANRDAQGEAQGSWTTGGPNQGEGGGRFPGVLDLQGRLTQGHLAQLHRYLPLHIPQRVRDYLREAVTAGHASGVNFKVKGDLARLPFTQAGDGEFLISGQVSDVAYAYIPRSLQAKDALPWPAFTQASGEVRIQGNSLSIRNASGKIAGAPGVVMQHGNATLTDMTQHPNVQVSLEARGPLNDMLRVGVNGSPVSELLGQTLAQSRATGAGDLQLKLEVPLAEPENTKVQGKLRLAGNDVQLRRELPWISKASGSLHFSEQGFVLTDGVARVLGGEVHAEGGTLPMPGKPLAGSPMLRLQGTFTADGLRQAREVPVLTQLGQQATGKAAYTASVNLYRGVPQFSFNSNLQGLGLNLPQPLAKRAEATLPLRLETLPLRDPRQDQISLDIGRVASVRYVRELGGPEPKVLRGSMVVGSGEPLLPPTQGVAAKLTLSRLDLDTWRRIFNGAGQTTGAIPVAGDAWRAYLPTTVVIQTEELLAGGHPFNRLVAGVTRNGRVWQANVESTEFSGYMEYTESTDIRAGRVYARLARLTLAQSDASEVEDLLEEQPVSIPALDVVADELELRGKKLGRLEMEAINRGNASRDAGAREWRLNKLNILSRDASFMASGNWAVINEAGGPTRAPVNRARSERRRTSIQFKLKVDDAGALLTRLGMKDVFRRGEGVMEGQASWLGSPMAIDYPSMNGAFKLNIEDGQFLKADPGAAKLLGVLNLQALPRRLTLDFRDVFSDGFAFDHVRGDVRIDRGIASTSNLQMKGVNAAVMMEGKADIARETQEVKVVVVPEINAGTASLIAGWTNPLLGLGSFLAQLILRKPLIESNTQEFMLTGTWTDPKIERIELGKDAPAPAKP